MNLSAPRLGGDFGAVHLVVGGSDRSHRVRLLRRPWRDPDPCYALVGVLRFFVIGGTAKALAQCGRQLSAVVTAGCRSMPRPFRRNT